MSDGGGKEPKKMSALGDFTIGFAIVVLLWCGAHLDSQQFFLWLVGVIACIVLIIFVAALEDYFNWEFDDDEDEEE